MTVPFGGGQRRGSNETVALGHELVFARASAGLIGLPGLPTCRYLGSFDSLNRRDSHAVNIVARVAMSALKD